MGEDYIYLWGYKLVSVHEFYHFTYLPFQILCTGTNIEYCDRYDHFETNWYTQFGTYFVNICLKFPESIQLLLFCIAYCWFQFVYLMTLEKNSSTYYDFIY